MLTFPPLMLQQVLELCQPKFETIRYTNLAIEHSRRSQQLYIRTSRGALGNLTCKAHPVT
jgi:hypothetical protein